MQKLTLSQPLQEIMYLQDFGANPDKYGKLGVRGHIGVDVNFGMGDPVRCPVVGTVVYVAFDTVVVLSDVDTEGKCLEVSFGHGNNYPVKAGDRVNRGDVLCYQGSTGLTSLYDTPDASWSHLHISVREAKLTTAPTQQKLRWGWNAQSPIHYDVIEWDESIDHFRDPNLYWDKVIMLVAYAMKRKEGSNPLWNNPLSLRNSPREDGYVITQTNGRFSTFTTPQRGMDAGLVQLRLASAGGSAYQKPDFTLFEFYAGRLGADKLRHGGYAPTSENDSQLYATQIRAWVGLRNIDKDPISDWQLTELEWAKKYNDGRQMVYPDGQLAGIMLAFKALWSWFQKDKK